MTYLVHSVLLCGVLLLSGCLNISASLQPENASVPEIREASDCVPIIFGFAYGHATIDNALAEKVRTIESQQSYGKVKVTSTPQTIRQIRRVELHDYQFLMFGARCVEVVGE